MRPDINRKSLTKGFTLVELVIVIIILAAIGISTSSYIATGVDIYTDITERDKSLNSVRFVIERMRREVSSALPNSAVLDGDCLRFNPIIATSLYGSNFPINPIRGKTGKISPIEDYELINGDRAVVYLLNNSELTSTKVKRITKINTTKDQLTFVGNLGFPLSSPAKRLYIIRGSISYCFAGTSIYREATANIHGNGSKSRALMAEGITGSFNVVDATLQRNSLVQVKFAINLDGQEVYFEETLHINNIP